MAKNETTTASRGAAPADPETDPVIDRSIDRAMVLSAGLGTRMRPITDSIPKPLVPVLGRTLLDRALDHVETAGISRAVVNTHYLGEQIAAHLKERTSPAIDLSDEADLLETGGGVLKALPKLGDGPFFVLNSDALWIDGPVPAMSRMRDAWDAERMDALLLVHPTVTAVGYSRKGDFTMEPDGRLYRRQEWEIAPFLFTGIQILHPRLFEGETPGKFSLNRLYDKALEAERLYGIRHDGEWYHVGSPDELKLAEAILSGEMLRTPYF